VESVAIVLCYGHLAFHVRLAVLIGDTSRGATTPVPGRQHTREGEKKTARGGLPVNIYVGGKMDLLHGALHGRRLGIVS
jgi:hypothetical protein